MYVQSHKKQLPATSESFFTPNKLQNPSSVETNPSANFVNSLSPINLVSPSLNFNSTPSYQYSNIDLSQSFNDSPSFVSPNRQISSFLMTPYQDSPQYGQKPEKIQIKNQESYSRLKTESFIELKKLDEISQSDKSQKRTISQYEIKDFMKMLQIIRAQKVTKQRITKEYNSRIVRNNFLTKLIHQKQEQLQYHKNQVQKRIRKKNELIKKIRDKKRKIKIQQQNQFQELKAKSSQMNQQFYQMKRNLQSQLQNIQLMQKLKNTYDQLLRQRSLSQQYYGHNSPLPYGNGNYVYQQLSSPSFCFQNPEQILLQKKFSSPKKMSMRQTPNSSEQNSARSKKSYKNSNSKPPVSQHQILQILRQHFTRQLSDENQQNRNTRNQQKKNHKKNVNFKKAIDVMIESLSERQHSAQASYRSIQKSETQSQIAIDCESLENYSEYKVNQSQFNQSKKKRSAGHSPTSRDPVHVSDKKVTGAAKQFLQSIVNIMYEGSQFSDNFHKNNDFFSPRPQVQENNKRRNRSISQEAFYPKVKTKTIEAGKSEVKLNDSNKKSGSQTPVFRSQNSEQENSVRFSQMLLTSLRNENGQKDENLGISQTNEEKQLDNFLKGSLRKTQQKVVHQSELIKIEEQVESNQKNERQFVTINNETQQGNNSIEIIDSDNQDFNFKLKEESKILKSSKLPSQKINTEQEEYSKSMQGLAQDQDIFEQLRKTDNSSIQKTSTHKKKIQQKRASLDLYRNQKSKYNFQTVLEQDQALEQDSKSLIYKKISSLKHPKTTL